LEEADLAGVEFEAGVDSEAVGCVVEVHGGCPGFERRIVVLFYQTITEGYMKLGCVARSNASGSSLTLRARRGGPAS
jgi:hypothetical protein